MVLRLSNGQQIILPPRKDLLGGMKFTRLFSQAGIHPYDELPWSRRDVRIMDWKTGKPIYERMGVEAPAHWDENAVKITTDKYLFGSEPGTPEYEDSLRQVFDRIANTYVVWGWEEGYFASLDDAAIFCDEIKAMLVKQVWAPNSPVWFNIGHWEQWRWGRPDLREQFTGNGNKAYHTKGKENALTTHTVTSTYEYPQCSACFLTEVADEMEAILEHLTTEGRIFASGSGVGINISTLRSSKEPIRGKGRSSGPISFDKGWDRMAGSIRSGGKTRRAARMVLMFSDHPDIFEFIQTKNKQENIAKVILREHNVHLELKELAEDKLITGNAAEKAAARLVLALPLATDAKFDPHMDGLLYGESLAHQNANHSVSVKGDFWQAHAANGNTYTRWVTNPSKIEATFRASDLLKAMAESIWDNGEPGVHNNDLINLWNPVKSLGNITTSNPCSEYVFLNNTSCNLSSFNAYRFLKKTAHGVEFNPEEIIHAARLAMVCADLNIERGGFPIPEIAEGTYRFRTTGIGYANLGGALMSLGVPYDSDEGRWIASQLCSILTASCWAASAEMGQELGSYIEYDKTSKDLKEVLRLHLASQKLAHTIGHNDHSEAELDAIIAAIINSADGSLPESQGLDAQFALRAFAKGFTHTDHIDKSRIKPAQKLSDTALKLWTKVCKAKALRNSFVSVMAPTGTISAPLGCYDEGTTSIEPDYTLVKWKQLSGGGSLKMFNRLALEGLRTLGYPERLVHEAAFEVAGLDGLIVSCNGNMDEVVGHLIADPAEGEAGPIRCAWRRLVGEKTNRIDIQDLIAHLSNPAHAAGFSADETVVYQGSAHVESLPWLRKSDLPVFDCAASNGDGQRSIVPEGHLRMLGAVQPFISGASSKTVNLPVSATVDEIYRSLVLSHDLGVKCIALFRAASKANSVYMLDTPETRKFKAEHIWTELVNSGKKSIDEIVSEASKPKQRSLPGRRFAQTIKFAVAGQITGYLTIGVYPDGSCGEVFGRLGQVGSFASGMFEAYCKLLSMALQFGVPVHEVVKGFRSYSFEPSGFCQVGDDTDDGVCSDIRSCSSVVDLIAKILDWLFPLENNSKMRGIFNGTLTIPGVGQVSASADLNPPDSTLIGSSANPASSAHVFGTTNTADNHTPKPVAPATGSLNGAAICPQCSSLAYVQDGKCKSCRSCGYKDGGCGE